MTDSRVLTRDEFEKTIWDFAIDYGRCDHAEARELYAPIRIHDAAQREEIDRIRERLKEALERLQKPSDTDDYNESWASRTFSEVFGQEGKD